VEHLEARRRIAELERQPRPEGAKPAPQTDQAAIEPAVRDSMERVGRRARNGRIWVIEGASVWFRGR